MRKLLGGTVVLVGLATMVPLGPAYALDPMIEAGGGGSTRTDCYATFKATFNPESSRPRRVRCVDGNPACDADGTVDGVCSFPVEVCANSTFDPGRCTSTGIDSLTVLHADDDGIDPKFDPDLQALQADVDGAIAPPTADADVCSGASTIRVRIKGPVGKPLSKKDRCRRNVKTVRLSTLPGSVSGSGDSDKLRLICLPASSDDLGCDAYHLFGGTFDRIQKQVFNTSCAVATCHDSESYMLSANLLLESGASHASLVGQDPTTFPAVGLGWKRVTAGDSAASLLYHKVTDDLDDAPGLGERMPRPPGRRMLSKSVREIIRLWIDAGAPENGWIPNTY